MSHKLPFSDFRARQVLDPDDFAGGDGSPDPPPSDLVSEDVWRSIVVLADDVAIRTSDHHGSVLAAQHGLWAALVQALPYEAYEGGGDPVARALFDANDELHAATYEMLTGYYRQAASSLRSAVEVLLMGAYCTITGKAVNTFQYRVFRDGLGTSPQAKTLDEHLRSRCDRCVFASAKNEPWLGYLYGRLTDYAHVHEGHSLADIRKSNGPIHVPSAIIDIHLLFVETFMLLAVLARLARPDVSIIDEGRDHLLTSGVVPPDVAAHAFVALFPDSFPDAAVFEDQGEEASNS